MTVSEVLAAVPLWLANGALAVLYWIVANFFTFLSGLVALVIAFGIDPFIQARASDRPRRGERGTVHTVSPVATYLTLGAAFFWSIVSLTSEFPIPLIGFLLWVIGLVAILVMSEERPNQLWWVKIGIVAYGFLVLGLRLVLFYMKVTDPTAWASFLGSSGDAQVVLENTRHNVATIGILFTFIVYPLWFAGLLLNRLLRNPKPNFNLFTEAGTVIRRIRTRQP
jgi:hypothetical protein